MAYSSLRSPWRSNESASTATANLSTAFIFPRPRERRRRSFTLCLEPPTSSCSLYSDAGHLIGNVSKKEAILADGSFSIAEKIVPCKVTKGKGVDKENVTKKFGSGAKLKLVGDKKLPFWGRMVFASNKIKSIILLNVITVVYASDIAVIKQVESVMDPAAFAAVRFTISAIPFLPFVFRARDDVKTRKAGMELGLWLSLGYLVEALGLLTSEAGLASFFSVFTVIIVALLDGMLGAMVPARTWFGVLMSMVGVGVLECSGSPPNVGDLLNFLSAVFFGIHNSTCSEPNTSQGAQRRRTSWPFSDIRYRWLLYCQHCGTLLEDGLVCKILNNYLGQGQRCGIQLKRFRGCLHFTLAFFLLHYAFGSRWQPCATSLLLRRPYSMGLSRFGELLLHGFCSVRDGEPWDGLGLPLSWVET